MNTTTTTPLEPLTATQASTNEPFFSMLEPFDTSTIPPFTELLAEYQATISKPAVARNIRSLDPPAEPTATDQPTRWLCIFSPYLSLT